jgi:hypothetical protein
MDGAIASGIALIHAAMNGNGFIVERVSNNKLLFMLSVPAEPAVAGLGHSIGHWGAMHRRPKRLKRKV